MMPWKLPRIRFIFGLKKVVVIGVHGVLTADVAGHAGLPRGQLRELSEGGDLARHSGGVVTAFVDIILGGLLLETLSTTDLL